MSVVSSSVSAALAFLSGFHGIHVNRVRGWLLVVVLLCAIAVTSAQEEPQQFDLDARNYYGLQTHPRYALYRLMKRAATAVKRERIIMDALGGDYLVRKRSIYI